MRVPANPPEIAVMAISAATGSPLDRKSANAFCCAALTVLAVATGFTSDSVVHNRVVYMTKAQVRCPASRYGLTRGTSCWPSGCCRPDRTIHHPTKPCIAPRQISTLSYRSDTKYCFFVSQFPGIAREFFRDCRQRFYIERGPIFSAGTVCSRSTQTTTAV